MTAPDGAGGDTFGYSVSQSDNILAVGAYQADTGVSDAGAAYLYQLEANGSATYLTKVTAPDRAGGDKFGVSVSQSGNILAVGAYWADPGGLYDAMVYTYNTSHFFEPIPGDRDGDGFSDLQEANASTDPDSNTSFPTTQFGLLANY